MPHRHSWLAAAPFAFAALLSSGAAHAVVLPGPTPLPGAVAFADFALDIADDRHSSVLGTFDDSAGPGCGGTCRAVTSLGLSPSVSLDVDQISLDSLTGSGARASLGYYVEYVNAPGLYTLDLQTSDSLSAPDLFASAEAHLKLGVAGSNPGHLGDFDDALALEETDCTANCPALLFPGFVGAFPAHSAIQMVANVPYFLQMDVVILSQPNDAADHASIDPMFSDPLDQGGHFLFSPGVLGGAAGVPEPGGWLLALTGFGLVGAAVRRRERHAA